MQAAFSMLQHNPGSTILYETGWLLAGAASGWAARQVVRHLKWDRRFRWFRYDNEWHYLLTGEILEISDISPIIQLNKAKPIDLVLVDALVKLEDGNILYSGILAGYELAADGGLRIIYLHSTQRKQLSSLNTEGTSSAEYYPVEGDLLTLPYAQLLNLNISYFLDEQDAQIEGDDAAAAAVSDDTQISTSDSESTPSEPA